jgi:hypothetical protein
LIADEAANRDGANRDFQTIAILGFAADAGFLSEPQVEALKRGLTRLAGRSPVVSGVAMPYCSDAAGILGIALGTAVVADANVTGQIALWAARFLRSSYDRDRAEDWQRCLFAAADRKMGCPLGLPTPNSMTTADVRIALLASGLIDGADAQPRLDTASTLELAVQELPEDFSCEQAALRLKALKLATDARLSTGDHEELNSLGLSMTEALRTGPDVHVFWGPYWTGGMLSFRNEGTEAAKNVRLQCSTESPRKSALRPEVVASIAPGGTVRVVDESGHTPGHGQCVAEFVHSLPSKEHRVTVTFEDRIGEQRARDFRVVATGRHAMTESLAVTFYAEALRIVRPPGAALRGGVPGIGIANQSQGADSVQALRAQSPQETRKGRNGKKPVRRNVNYEGIDRALSEISAARPKNHEEVFRFLDDRKVVIPNRKPFKAAGGWLKGFQQNRHTASAWLSQAWGRLDLPAFARGPKK